MSGGGAGQMYESLRADSLVSLERLLRAPVPAECMYAALLVELYENALPRGAEWSETLAMERAVEYVLADEYIEAIDGRPIRVKLGPSVDPIGYDAAHGVGEFGRCVDRLVANGHDLVALERHGERVFVTARKWREWMQI